MATAISLAEHFARFAQGVIGHDASITTAHGPQPLRYADWTASGRAYAPLEERLLRDIGPYIANTHTETSFTGQAMTRAYQRAREIVKQHVHAGRGLADGDGVGDVGLGVRDAGNDAAAEAAEFVSVRKVADHKSADQAACAGDQDFRFAGHARSPDTLTAKICH